MATPTLALPREGGDVLSDLSKGTFCGADPALQRPVCWESNGFFALLRMTIRG